MSLEPFLSYMERYNPGYRSRIRGVSEREIALMEELYQRPLPESYKEFLRVMGADSGGFHLVNDADSAYDAVMERVKDRLEEPKWSLPLRDFVIVAVRFFMEEDLALHDALGGEPPVVGVDLTPYMVFSSSLDNRMLSAVFVRHRMWEFPLRRAWAGFALPDRRRSTDILESLGFTFLSFSDLYVGAAERGEACASIQQFEGHALSVTVSTTDPKVLDEVEAVVERELGLRSENVYTIPG